MWEIRKTDVRSRRGVDITSDHHVVVANLKLKLKKNWTTRETALQRFNTAFLRDTDKLTEFKITTNKRLQSLQDLLKEGETSIEDNWKGIKEALNSTCEELLGLKKHQHKEWISIETLDKIKERKNKKAAINNSRTRAEKVQPQAEHGIHGIRWTAQNQLDDLDFADDLALLSYTHEQMQMETASAAASASIGLNIHKGKTKVLKHNTENTNPTNPLAGYHQQQPSVEENKPASSCGEN
ncbi:unnamed protein product [Schistosoma margrebowiei]|uniref:Uncharacterized protein n=1 Tax=Schistosoma margrebowiei TaxID=48269 RepID=A0A183LUY0_9TREM|nr:unnamed protein product [Schistosoma margrebowiei]